MANGSSYYIGKQIGNYRVVTELASSFFSRVFRGEHVFLSQRVVAINQSRQGVPWLPAMGRNWRGFQHGTEKILTH